MTLEFPLSPRPLLLNAQVKQLFQKALDAYEPLALQFLELKGCRDALRLVEANRTYDGLLQRFRAASEPLISRYPRFHQDISPREGWEQAVCNYWRRLHPDLDARLATVMSP